MLVLKTDQNVNVPREIPSKTENAFVLYCQNVPRIDTARPVSRYELTGHVRVRSRPMSFSCFNCCLVNDFNYLFLINFFLPPIHFSITSVRF